MNPGNWIKSDYGLGLLEIRVSVRIFLNYSAVIFNKLADVTSDLHSVIACWNSIENEATLTINFWLERWTSCSSLLPAIGTELKLERYE